MTYHNQKHLFFLFLLSLCSYSGISQSYFNRIFEFDDVVPLPFEIIQLSSDSFVINTKTILNFKESNLIIAYDAASDQYNRYDLEGITPNIRSLLKIKDHFYLYATDTNEENDSLTLIKMNSGFDVLEQTHFLSPESLMHQAKVLAINNSIYCASAYDPLGDQTRLTHFKKIDTLGNEFWVENYFDDARSKGDSDYTVSSDQQILSANTIRFDIFDTFPQVVKTDTTGNVIWRYDHTEETESIASALVHLNNDNIIFTSVVDISFNELVMKFIWLDKDGNYVKEKLILPYENFELYGMNNLVEGKGDYFFGHGDYRENAPDSVFKESYGLITKFDNEGEVIWTHRYKHPDYSLNSDFTNIIDLIEEENGDIVVLGHIIRASDPSPYKVWLFRLDSTGCPDPAYCDEFINFTSTQEASTAYQDLTVFPNPASHDIYIDLPEKNQSGILEIITSFGTVVKSDIIHNSSAQIEMDVTDFPPGMYYVRFRNRNENIIYRSSFIVLDR